ncbi:DUF1846 family protein, partial [Enterococcus faecalis]|nr:DUF1846 family protein [Enterococcus faecalis]
CLLNALKEMANIGEDLHLMPPVILDTINKLNHDKLKNTSKILDCKEALIALSISAVTNPSAEVALLQVEKLRNLQAHSSAILPKADEEIFRDLGIMVTSEPQFATESLFYGV